MKINCIIVDDEPLARKGLSEYISEIGFLDLKGACESAAAANELLTQQKTDLIFLDIQMPKMTGIAFLKTLREPPMIIFTTAHPEYALQGYELNVLDYLLKPVSFDRFLKAANQAREFYELKMNPTAQQKPADHFFIRCDNQYEKILFDELLYAESLENYVALQTKTKKYISYLTLKTVEDYLPSGNFIKVHKSFIVSVAAIGKIEGNEIKIGNHSIPISRNLKDEVMNKIVHNKLLKR
jgi:DNA-binding LytR/AlgR family response regulator